MRGGLGALGAGTLLSALVSVLPAAARQITDFRQGGGPEGGHVTSVAISAADGWSYVSVFGKVYARPPTDDAPWRISSNGLPFTTFTRLFASPSTPGRVAAGGFEGVLASVDFGQTWGGSETSPSFVQDVAFDPFDSEILFAAALDGLYRSADGGRSWMRLDPEGIDTEGAAAVAVDPTNPSFLWAGGSFGLLQSSDAGVTWRRSDGAIPGIESTSVELVEVFDLATSGDGVLVALGLCSASVSGGFFGSCTVETSDRGATLLASRAPGRVLTLDPNDSRRRYAIEEDVDGARVYFSNDGRSYEEVEVALLDGAADVAISGIDPSFQLVVGTQGVVSTSDAGATWEPSNAGLVATAVLRLATTPDCPGTLVAVADGVGGGAISRSEDSGESWSEVITDLDTIGASLAAAGDRVIADSRSGTFRSDDCGRTWTLLPRNVRSIALAPSAPDVAYGIEAGLEAGEVLRSNDGGVTWIALPAPFAVRSPELGLGGRFVVDPNDPNTVYHAAPDIEALGPPPFGPLAEVTALWRSLDGGVSWARLTRELSNVGGLTVAADGEVLIYVDRDFSSSGEEGLGLFSSSDRGESFDRVARTAPIGNVFISNRSLVLEPRCRAAGCPLQSLGRSPARAPVAFGTPDRGVFEIQRSSPATSATDSPPLESWAALGGLSTGRVPALAFDGISKLFAGTDGGGVFRAELRDLRNCAGLCLNGFSLSAVWQDFEGRTGAGVPVALSADTGYFWFFDPKNVDLVVKVVDARGVNGAYWVFYASLSNVRFELDVEEIASGRRKSYANGLGTFASLGDVDAFPSAVQVARELQAPSPAAVAGGESGLAFDYATPVRVGTPILFFDNIESTSITSRGGLRTWDFGDGSELLRTFRGEVVHTFRTAGGFRVSLSAEGEVVEQLVEALQELTQSASLAIAGPGQARLGEEVTLSASASGCEPRIDGWQWTVQGGEILGRRSGASIRVRWSAAGAKRVTLRNVSCGERIAQRNIAVEEPTDGAPCQASATKLCLNGSRFEASVTYQTAGGQSGPGQTIPLSDDTGSFWFFDRANTELVVKIIDGSAVNDRIWVFYGSLSNVAFELTVRDTRSGATKVYRNPLGAFASIGDVNAFQ